MNILKILFDRGIYNAPVINDLEKENHRLLRKLEAEFFFNLDNPVSMEVVRIVALKYFLECYKADEIIEILDYFQLLSPAEKKFEWSKEDEVATKEE